MDMDMGLDASHRTSVGAGAAFDLPSAVPGTGTDAVAASLDESAISNAVGLSRLDESAVGAEGREEDDAEREEEKEEGERNGAASEGGNGTSAVTNGDTAWTKRSHAMMRVLRGELRKARRRLRKTVRNRAPLVLLLT